MRIAIIGAGEMGIQAAHFIEVVNTHSPEKRHKVVGWYDDTKVKGEFVNSIPVLGSISGVEKDYDGKLFDAVFIAIGYKHLKYKCDLINEFKGRIPMHNIVACPQYIDKDSLIGENVMIYPGVVVDKGVEIEDGVTLDLGVIVSHDTKVGAGSFLAPGSKVAGFCNLGKRNFIGIGSTIIDSISTTDDVRLGGGTVVIRNITDSGTHAGVPAQKLQK